MGAIDTAGKLVGGLKDRAVVEACVHGLSTEDFAAERIERHLDGALQLSVGEIGDHPYPSLTWVTAGLGKYRHLAEKPSGLVLKSLPVAEEIDAAP